MGGTRGYPKPQTTADAGSSSGAEDVLGGAPPDILAGRQAYAVAVFLVAAMFGVSRAGSTIDVAAGRDLFQTQTLGISFTGFGDLEGGAALRIRLRQTARSYGRKGRDACAARLLVWHTLASLWTKKVSMTTPSGCNGETIGR